MIGVKFSSEVPAHPMDFGYLTAGIRVSKSQNTHAHTHTHNKNTYPCDKLPVMAPTTHLKHSDNKTET